MELAAKYDRTVALMAHTVGNKDDQWISTRDFHEVLDQLENSDLDVVTPTSYWSEVIDLLSNR